MGLVAAVVHLSFAQAAHLQQRTEELAAASAESDRLRAMAEQRLHRVSMVYRSSVELVGAQQDDTMPRVLADIAARAFGFDAVVVCLYEPAQASPRVAAAWPILPADERAVLRLVSDSRLTERLREGEAWYALQEADGRRAGAAGLHGVKAAAPPTEEAAVPWPVTTVLPLLAGEHLFGMLVAGYLTARDLALHDRHLLSMLAHRGAQALLRLKLGREASEVETLRRVDRARTQVLATVSHELRSPLTAVAGYSELLCSEDLSPQEVRETAWHIAADARRLLYLVEDITTFYRLGSAAFRIFPERLEVVPLLEEALTLARPAASATRHQFVLDVDLDRPLPDVYIYRPGTGITDPRELAEQRSEVLATGLYGAAGRACSPESTRLRGRGSRRRHCTRRPGAHLRALLSDSAQRPPGHPGHRAGSGDRQAAGGAPERQH